MSFEHIPPESAFNSSRVKSYNVIDLVTDEGKFPWEFSKFKYAKEQQKGSGYNALCTECNSKFGHWYVPHYTKFTKTIEKCVVEELAKKSDLTNITIRFNNIPLLPIIKQIVLMFCVVNNSCFDDETIRQFLLNRDFHYIDKSKYRIGIYYNLGPFQKQIPLACMCTGNPPQNIVLSEISNYPLGFILHLNPKPDLKSLAFDITDFAYSTFDEKSNIDISLNLLESNIPFPNDFRSKKEIMIHSKR